MPIFCVKKNKKKHISISTNKINNKPKSSYFRDKKKF